MYAVVETGGKQYRVSQGDILEVESLPGKVGEAVDLSRVLMVQGEKDLKVGSPYIDGSVVKAEVVAQARGPKVIIFKKKRRKAYRRTKGHRQSLTRLKIVEIPSA
ncbi:MAG TPA: 50S ribosomal protein L21 [Nitrospiria bacterium]